MAKRIDNDRDEQRIINILKRGEVTQSSLCKMLSNWTQSRVSKTLKRLQDKGIIEKEEVYVRGKRTYKIRLKDNPTTKTEKIKEDKEDSEDVDSVIEELLAELEDEDEKVEQSKELETKSEINELEIKPEQSKQPKLKSEDQLQAPIDDINKTLEFLSRITGFDINTILTDAIRDWCLKNGISYGNVKSLFGVPIVEEDDIVVADETNGNRLYKVRGFGDLIFEDLIFSSINEHTNLHEVIKLAKIRSHLHNHITIILRTKNNKFRLLGERYNLIKDTYYPLGLIREKARYNRI